MMRIGRWSLEPARILLNLLLIGLSLLMLYPWLIAIGTSLKAPGESGANPGIVPQQWDVAKFGEVFWAVDMPRLALNSVLITGATVALVLLLADRALRRSERAVADTA